jgi:hypothetical protein
MSGLYLPAFTETPPGILSFVQVYGIQLQHLNPELPEDQNYVVGRGSSRASFRPPSSSPAS